MTSVIKEDSFKELDVKEGDEVYLIIKSTEIMICKSK